MADLYLDRLTRENARLYMRPDPRRFMRPDAERWRQHNPGLYGGAPNVLANNARSAAWSADAAARVADAEQELEALRHSLDEMRALAAEINHDLAMRRLARKYSPDQPRVPAGNPDGGQWTSEGGANVGEDSGPSPETQLAGIVIRICLAGSRSLTEDEWGNKSHWVEYQCADGRSFIVRGPGHKYRRFVLDPSR